LPDTCEPLPGAATPLWGSGSSLSVVAILSLLVVLCWGPEALGHDSPPTRAQARELAQMSRVLHLRGGRVTPANLPDLDACLVSFGAGDLKHVAVHLREAGESAKRQREAVEAVWYARHVVQGVVDAPSITVGGECQDSCRLEPSFYAASFSESLATALALCAGLSTTVLTWLQSRVLPVHRFGFRDLAAL